MAGEKKIIKIDGGKKQLKKLEEKLEEKLACLTEEEVKLKDELIELDRKVESISKVINLIEPTCENSIVEEDTLINIVCIATVSVATSIIGKYLGVDEDTLKNLI